ncbi:MAG TPA: hypothetical protein VFI76_09105 [Terrimicrobiaceae bacterium]|nr:hypothetical protein [Terrimicrobiaceae bacterium]
MNLTQVRSSLKFGLLKASSSVALEPASFLATMGRRIFSVFLVIGTLFVVGLLFWQGITAGGNPNPTAENTSQLAAMFDIAVLVFREGLDAYSCLRQSWPEWSETAKFTAGPSSLALGPGWSPRSLRGLSLSAERPWRQRFSTQSSGRHGVACHCRAAGDHELVLPQGLLGRLDLHAHPQEAAPAQGGDGPSKRLENGSLARIGAAGLRFLYREGFEIVLFLQTYNLKLGSAITLAGAAIGLVFVGIVAVRLTP